MVRSNNTKILSIFLPYIRSEQKKCITNLTLPNSSSCHVLFYFAHSLSFFTHNIQRWWKADRVVWKVVDGGDSSTLTIL